MALVVVVLLTVLGITAGLFDPQPYGSLLRTDNPGPRDLGATAEVQYPQSPPWTQATSPGRYSVRLTAAYEAGEEDSAYGLAVGDGDERVVIALSPLGYVAVRSGSDSAPDYVIPWQVWPHVRSGTAENEIWVDVARDGPDALFTIRLNRELLWEGKVAGTTADIALWQATYGSPATTDFRSLEWFAEP